MEEMRNAYKILVGKPEGKKQLGRPRGRWQDNIRVDLREMRWGSVDWINLAKDRDQWQALMNRYFLTSVATVSFSRRTQLHGVGYYFSERRAVVV
jgi:hypothetical protein